MSDGLRYAVPAPCYEIVTSNHVRFAMICNNDTPPATGLIPSRASTGIGRPGRPTKRTHALVREVVSLIESGTPVKQAARHVGVDPVTLWRWRRRDPDLDRAVLVARAAFLRRQVERIERAAEDDVRAASWLLGRAEPAEWGKRVEVAVDTAPRPIIDPLAGRVIGVGEGEMDADAGA